MWDVGGYVVNKFVFGGWICCIDFEGKLFELVSVGYCNEYDIVFNLSGDFFMYDVDMEWDVGILWYWLICVCYVIFGSEFGW